jgi:hypothetical protein
MISVDEGSSLSMAAVIEKEPQEDSE